MKNGHYEDSDIKKIVSLDGIDKAELDNRALRHQELGGGCSKKSENERKS